MKEDQQPWRKAVLFPGSSIREAINSLNCGLRIVLIVGDGNKLVGTISDGDIRRGMLKGLTLDSSLDLIVHRDPLVVPTGTKREVVRNLMVANKIQQIPIVNADNEITGLHLWHEDFDQIVHTNKMVIMAGGRGTRLHPQTENCPKPMLQIAGKPILEHIIDRAKKEGFSDFILAIHHLGEVIEDHFGDGSRFGVKIDYLREATPLGTAGALSLLDPLPEAPIIVTNGDVVTDIRYGELLDFHVAHKALATMAVRRQELQNPFGVVEIQGVEIVNYEEKPVVRNYINAGVYVLDSSTLQYIERSTPTDMPGVFSVLSSNGKRTIAYPLHEEWLDIGRPDDFEQARLQIENK